MRAIEDFGCKSDHPAGEAGEVLAVRREDLVGGGGDGEYAGEEDCAVFGGEGAEEEFFDGDRDETFVHFAVLWGAAAKEEIFLKREIVSN